MLEPFQNQKKVRFSDVFRLFYFRFRTMACIPGNRTIFYHLNMGLVQYSDCYCIFENQLCSHLLNWNGFYEGTLCFSHDISLIEWSTVYFILTSYFVQSTLDIARPDVLHIGMIQYRMPKAVVRLSQKTMIITLD